MSKHPTLSWLPTDESFKSKLKSLGDDPHTVWQTALALANTRLDFVRTNALDTTLKNSLGIEPPPNLAPQAVRLAVLASSTTTHLLAAIRIAALRRDIHVSVYEADYGQYLQELLNQSSALHRFKPTAVLFAFDAHHLTQGFEIASGARQADEALDAVLGKIKQCWQLASKHFACHIIQQTVLNVFPALMGNNEQRLPGSRRRAVTNINGALRELADRFQVDLLAVDERAAEDGLLGWHDSNLWHRSKQEITPLAAPIFGELVGRLIAAKRGLSRKCLVVDLDNTLWGGVIGEDGLDGIVIGQGSALGEAYLALQHYIRDLSQRGIILAVCSKNDEANALEAFEKHPEMVLRPSDIACFKANWHDKASNLRAIAAELNIGLDAMVFLDDSAFERSLIRQELPMVAVPEVSDEPTDMLKALSDSGYFESVALTDDDRARSKNYQSNAERETLKSSSTDLEGYLKGLEMKLICTPFDQLGLQRSVQLINKTNQFNLTTRRYTTDEAAAVINDPKAFGLQLRLLDRFGDNGTIGIIIARIQNNTDLHIDTWLMSCRVLGRQVELASLNVLATAAKHFGARRLIGEFIPTAKNGMVRHHYQKLGFELITEMKSGISTWQLDLATYAAKSTLLDVEEFAL